MRAIIICGGRETRWNNYLGVPKQLVPIEGVPLLHRTVAQLQARNVRDIHIIAGDARFDVPGATLHILSAGMLWPTDTDADKFLSSKLLWNRSGRTVVFYGDVYFTEKAMDTIVFYPEHNWQLFCRFGPDDQSGNPQGGECFAQSFYPDYIPEHEAALMKVANANLSQKGGWEHYRAMNGVPSGRLHVHRRYSRHTEINDLTDDFDYPESYDVWRRLYEGTPPQLR